MKHLLISLSILSMMTFMSCKNSSYAQSIPTGAFLVDVRTPAELIDGSVPNAINIPLGEIEDNLDKFKNKENILVFCRSGNRSGKAKAILEANGFKNVTNGGSWKNVLNLIKAE